MSISCYCARNAFGKHSLKMTKVETFKAAVELRCYRNVSRNNLVIINSVARSLSGTGPKTPSSDMSKNDGEKSKESTSEIKQDKYLENFKPLSEQTDKILKVIQTASKQITENATKYYHEKRNYLAKGKLLSPEGEEEHWYAARVNFLMKRYENFVGLTDVKNAQVRVQKTEKLFVKSQDDRRETQRLINEVQAKIKNLHTELERTHRGEDKYLELVTLEHQVLREERILIEQLSQLERDEREAFSRLSRAVRDSHESERAQAEKTKYWAVLGSIIGTTLGVLGTTINNRLRMRELRQIVRDAATGHSQIGVAAAATGAAGSVVTLDHAQLNNNLASLTSGLAVVKDNISEFSENLQRVGNATTEKINEVSNSISTLSKDFNQQQSKSLEVMSLIDNHTKLNLKSEKLPETINNKSLLELQKSIETQIMRWEEKMDNIMKLHFENSSDSKALSKLEKKVTEVLTFEKETTKLNARLHEEINRSGAIGTYKVKSKTKLEKNTEHWVHIDFA